MTRHIRRRDFLRGLAAVGGATAIGSKVWAADGVAAALRRAVAARPRARFDPRGHRLVVYGNSYLTSAAPYSQVNLLRDRYAMSLENHAQNAAMSYDTCQDAMGTGPASWTPGSAGTNDLVLVDVTLGECIVAGGGAVPLRSYANALRALLALLTARSFTDSTDPSFRYRGTWGTAFNAHVARGGSVQYTTTPGDSVDISFTGDKVTIVTGGFAAALARNASFDVKRRGRTLLASPGRDEAHTQNRIGNPDAGYVNRTVALAGFGAGEHTIRMRHTGRPGDYLLVDAVLRPSTTPPTVFVMKPVHLPQSSYDIGLAGCTDATVASYTAVLDKVVAEYPVGVSTVNALPGWNQATMLDLDAVHPSQAGYAHIFDAIVRHIAVLQRRR